MPFHWVALIGPEIEENLGLRYLSSSLISKGFGTAIIPFNFGEELGIVLRKIQSAVNPPLIIAVSLSFQRRATDCMALIMALRETGFTGHITGGGHFGYFCRSELMKDFKEIDSICCGEAEEVIVELALSLKNNLPLAGIAGLFYRKPDNAIIENRLRPAPDINSIPWPDRQGRRSTCCGHRIAAIVGGRGCYGNCAFCCIAAWHRSNCLNKPFRARPVEDIADEMAMLHFEQDVDVFIFHDDNFFLPCREENMRRIHALADALDSRNMSCGRFATAVKARPTDISPEIISVMKERLGLYRIFLGVENASSQGLATLQRGVGRRQNHEAIKTLLAFNMYTCFNLLLFDPDTSANSILENLDFMTLYGSNPFFIGRVELYAGTPLLARMRKENRCNGDYFGWDYRLHDTIIQRIFDITMRCFYDRNYPPDSPVNILQSTRHDVEICRFFHPDLYNDQWLARIKRLCQNMADDSARRIKAIVDFVNIHGPDCDADEIATDFSRRMRDMDSRIIADAEDICRDVHSAVGKQCFHVQPISDELTIALPYVNSQAVLKTIIPEHSI